jgi:hypothetical protein
MKSAVMSVVVVLSISLLLIGCGKSEAFKKMESELNAQVMKLHEDQMKSVDELKGVVSQIDAAIANNDELAKKFAKKMGDHNVNDLVAAKEKIGTLGTQMEAWMKGFKKYDEKAKHEDVMKQLSGYKDELTTMGQNITETATAAKAALESQAAFATSLLPPAKPGKK